MRIPSSADLSELHGKSAEEYASWLGVGLREYLLEQKGRRAFPGAEHFIGEHHGLSEDLAYIIRALGARDQAAVKKACALTLEELSFDDEADALLAAELLRLGAKIKAVSLLEVLARKSFRLSPENGSTPLYNLAFEFSRDLADLSSNRATECLRHLINRDHGFRPALAGQALIALTEAAPEQFTQHWDLLCPFLDEAFGYSPTEKVDAQERARKTLVGSIIDRLPYQSLLHYPSLPRGEMRPEVTNWWFNTLRKGFPTIFNQLRTANIDPQPQRVELQRKPFVPAGPLKQNTLSYWERRSFGDTTQKLPSDVIEHSP